ncbi:MAG: PA2778 family cysteine peptidase [Pseudohongiella sp.]|nr:PA2778 family cysteine peptidase [Pseudohongiella sp.]
MALKLPVLLFLTLLLSACLAAPQSAGLRTELRQNVNASLSAPVLLSQVPFFAQDLYQCGPAALATVLTASGISVTPEQLVPLVYVPAREGSFQVEMVAATRSLGRLAYRLTPTLEALLSEVAAGQPVLVLQNLSLKWYPRWHFAVVKGFDVQAGRIILNSGMIENYDMSLATFERTWARAQHWAILTLSPGDMPVMGEPAAYFSALAAFEQNNASELAASAYISGLQHWPSDINLRMGYGNLLYSQQLPSHAHEQFSALLLEHPDYAPAHNNLAQILLEQGQGELALHHAQQAVALGGDYLLNYQSTLEAVEISLLPR